MVRSALAKSKRVLFLAHRKELIDQCSSKLDLFGVEHGIIRAGDKRLMPWLNAQVGSVQTLVNRDHYEADLVFIDECHRSPANTYQKVLDRFEKPPVIIGLTATPYRLDGRGLGDHFDSLVVGATAADLVERGRLMEPEVYSCGDLDLSTLKIRRGDFVFNNADDAMADMIRRGEILDNWKKHAYGLTTVVFAKDVEDSQRIVEQFREAGVRAAHLDGKTKPNVRAQLLDDLASRKLTVLSNVEVLCLDSKTEILTRDGWKGIDDFSKEDLVANWWPKDQSITFAKPKSVFRRKRKRGESMVSVSGRNANIRVTHDHRMLYKRSPEAGGYTKYKVAKASELVGQRIYYPVVGYVEPDKIKVDQDFLISEKKKKRLVVKSSHNLRKLNGYEYNASVAEAEKRIDAKYSLRTKAPHELTLDECWFIGFWLGDGSVTKLKSGGLEYVIQQSHRYMNIINKLIRTCDRMGLHYVYRDKTAPKSSHLQRRFSFPRGTGSGCQQRSGVYPFEKYLNKDFAEELWGLDHHQLWSLLRGFWCADGLHGDGENSSAALRIYNTNYNLLSKLQAVCVCRGIYASIRCNIPNGRLTTKKIHSLSVRLEKSEHQLVNDRLKLESDWKDEEVWCCNVESTFIVTRREGKVTIMGNCEGWDLPLLECVVLGRPTQSRSLYKQMVGRVMRVHEDKRRTLVLDHVKCTLLHGRVTAPEVYYLYKEKRKGKTFKMSDGVVDGVPTVTICPKCGFICSIDDDFCPECESDLIDEQSRVAETIEELRKLEDEKIKRQVFTKEEKQAFYIDMCRECMAWNHNPGWVAHKYKDKFGVWPRQLEVPDEFAKYKKDWANGETSNRSRPSDNFSQSPESQSQWDF